jgi:hypothetical protein
MHQHQPWMPGPGRSPGTLACVAPQVYTLMCVEEGSPGCLAGAELQACKLEICLDKNWCAKRFSHGCLGQEAGHQAPLHVLYHKPTVMCVEEGAPGCLAGAVVAD